MRCLIAAALSFFIITGCSGDSKPETIINQDTYIDLLIELQLLKSYQEDQFADSTTVDSLKKIIFDEYKTTEAQFRKSHTYYQQDLTKQSERIKKAIERLRKDQLGTRDSTSVSTAK